MVESCEETIALEESWRKPLGKAGNCRKETLERPVGKRSTRLGKKA